MDSLFEKHQFELGFSFTGLRVGKNCWASKPKTPVSLQVLHLLAKLTFEPVRKEGCDLKPLDALRRQEGSGCAPNVVKTKNERLRD